MKLLFKASVLFLALGMTIYCIYLLNQGHLSDFMGSIGSKYTQTLSWCSNRITKMESLSDAKWIMEEKDKKWLVSKDGGAPLELSYLEVEKWMAQTCQLHILVYRSESLLDKHLAPFAKVSFNDGKEAKIYILENDTFQINEVIFKSPEMQTAVADFKKLLTLP